MEGGRSGERGEVRHELTRARDQQKTRPSAPTLNYLVSRAHYSSKPATQFSPLSHLTRDPFPIEIDSFLYSYRLLGVIFYTEEF